jgi:hypothetical protein
MNKRLALFLLSLCICMQWATAGYGQWLYPVEGPLAKSVPPPVFAAKLTGVNSGTISLTLSNGETFSGRWATVAPAFVNAKKPGSDVATLPQPNLAFTWDTIYGQGYFLAQLLGEHIGQAILTGDRGTTLQLEFLDGKFGVALDSKGNTYKVAW